MTPFNINDDIWVKLTPLGKTIYRAHWAHALRGSGLKAPNLTRDKEGRVRFQLWDLMHIYGPLIWHGSEQVFEDSTIFFP